MKLTWINKEVTQREHERLIANACYAVEVISYSLKRANALEAIKQAHDAGYMTDEEHKEVLSVILKNEGLKVTFTE